MEKETSTKFLGLGWTFPPVFDEQMHNVLMVSDEEDIRQSLRVLLSTLPGERPMNPEFGCDLRDLVFEPNTKSLLTLIEDRIKTAIIRYEPRVTLESIKITGTDDFSNGEVIYVQLEYIIRSTNTRSNMVFPYYKIEGTNIDKK